jgi:hypothetical protein
MRAERRPAPILLRRCKDRVRGGGRDAVSPHGRDSERFSCGRFPFTGRCGFSDSSSPPTRINIVSTTAIAQSSLSFPTLLAAYVIEVLAEGVSAHLPNNLPVIQALRKPPQRASTIEATTRGLLWQSCREQQNLKLPLLRVLWSDASKEARCSKERGSRRHCRRRGRPSFELAAK